MKVGKSYRLNIKNLAFWRDFHILFYVYNQPFFLKSKYGAMPDKNMPAIDNGYE